MTVAESYRYCRKVARSRAKNFYYGFLFLPRRKKDALSAVYALMRICDDIADDASPPETKREAIALWKERLQNLFMGRDLSHPVFPALWDTVQNFEIPTSYFLELVEGVEMDLVPRRFQHFEELYPYCYKVASVVGLVCLYIFGFDEKKALEYAESCGIAFQLTNILRDLKEDVQMGRVYLPQEDLHKFGYSETSLMNLERNENFYRMMKFQIERAEGFYEKASPLPDHVEPDSRRALKVMMAVYRAILGKIKTRGCDTLSQRISLSPWAKLKILLANR